MPQRITLLAGPADAEASSDRRKEPTNSVTNTLPASSATTSPAAANAAIKTAANLIKRPR
jgi:hypothetical protein